MEEEKPKTKVPYIQLVDDPIEEEKSTIENLRQRSRLPPLYFEYATTKEQEEPRYTLDGQLEVSIDSREDEGYILKFQLAGKESQCYHIPIPESYKGLITMKMIMDRTSELLTRLWPEFNHMCCSRDQETAFFRRFEHALKRMRD